MMSAFAAFTPPWHPCTPRSTPRRVGPALLAAALAAQLALAGTPARADDKQASGTVGGPAAAPAAAQTKPARAALSVTLVSPQMSDWPLRLAATGSIAAWQEATISAEAAGLRMVEVLVNVGDVVRRGQTLARLNSDTLAADRDQTRAGLAEAEAMLLEARANADRARELQPSGMITSQQANQWLTAEQTAKARVASLKARLKADEVRLAQTRIVAPDDGVISARSATLGAVAQPGQELFRLIRRNRLEWRAEVPEADLGRIKPGQSVNVTASDGSTATGTVRMVAPTVDPQRRNGVVYVDLAASRSAAVRSGMFARGEFELGRASGLALPQTAVVLRDGFHYVLRVGPDSRVALTKVQVGRRQGDRLEITAGVDAAARVVAAGGGFLADGDLVRVVDAPAAARAGTAPAKGGSAAPAKNGQPG